MSFVYLKTNVNYMTTAKLKQVIHTSGKRAIVTYKGKDTRREFDESISLKKVNLISNFIGDKIEEIKTILAS
ncbi:hypothetical protein BBH99_00275 [Chryseobacterium contaminans]|uniref:Uncharacterized protein n=2 Tax=Chryseobacterium contaminans TaxID=1423959 RepID=A0A1M6VN02_9FLAO|nr:hypothetical protein BBH99_00275 [Chryseobacterium contaminans]SHK82947.1 hypothetical protein SAMN05444407_101289 [Chryseobacterium contaminans]